MTNIRVVDFETTGMDAKAEVCEVGICDVNLELRLIERPESWLCAVTSMPPEVRAIHHISWAECATWRVFNPDVICNETIDAIAIHNAAFELQFYSSPVPVICTYKAALRVWPDAPSHSNGALRYWLEDLGLITLDAALAQPAHRAGPDAYVTAHLLLALFNQGVTGKQMVAWTKEPALLPLCPLGKFRGRPWRDVDDGFLNWMLKQQDMEPDLKWNANVELERRQKENGYASQGR